MAKHCKLSANVQIRKPAVRLLYPLWVMQVKLGFEPWMPRWAIKVDVEAAPIN